MSNQPYLEQHKQSDGMASADPMGTFRKDRLSHSLGNNNSDRVFLRIRSNGRASLG